VTRTPLSRSKGQRSTCRGGGILWRLPAQLVKQLHRNFLIGLQSPDTMSQHEESRFNRKQLEDCGVCRLAVSTVYRPRPRPTKFLYSRCNAIAKYTRPILPTEVCFSLHRHVCLWECRVDNETARSSVHGPVVLFQRRRLLRSGVSSATTLRVG